MAIWGVPVIQGLGRAWGMVARKHLAWWRRVLAAGSWHHFVPGWPGTCVGPGDVVGVGDVVGLNYARGDAAGLEGCEADLATAARETGTDFWAVLRAWVCSASCVPADGRLDVQHRRLVDCLQGVEVNPEPVARHDAGTVQADGVRPVG
jgi:hypothetical protein